MKPSLFSGFAILLFTLAAHAQEEVVIPTEISEPPYGIGDLVLEQGYYIERGEDETKLNFRFIDNRLHVYWIDENGLIAEPEEASAIVRFTGSVRGRSYHNLTTLPSGAGLASAGVMVPPHLYNTILVFPALDGDEPASYSFRYTPSMDEPVDPTVDSDN